jgi:trk system potassium uptake protein TrkA
MMDVVIIGAGTQGKYIARTLANGNNNVTVIDKDFKVEELLSISQRDEIIIDVIVGDGCDYNVLENAKCNNADVVLACTGDDEDNLVIALLAKQEFGVPKVIARVNHPENEWLFNDHWGVDLAVSGSHILTALVEEEITSDHIIALLSLDDGKVNIVEIKLSASSNMVDKQLSEIDLPKECSIVAILREGHVVFSHDNTVLSIGDEIILLTKSEASEEVKNIFENAS